MFQFSGSSTRRRRHLIINAAAAPKWPELSRMSRWLFGSASGGRELDLVGCGGNDKDNREQMAIDHFDAFRPESKQN